MLKFLTSGLFVCMLVNPVYGADPVWREGITSDQYEITVYRNPSCGCCKAWISHLQDHNFIVKDVAVDDVNRFKHQFDVPTQAAACHTAIVDGLVIEGHVPAQDIKRLLADPGDIRMLAVPAMPSGTPGMDPAGAPRDPFRVYSISTDNRAEVFQTYTDY